ncbi:unsaturated rhamnogalacturonyl hydrolase [Catalinimonas alkaloidigena]|uniref:Unsaturated rhamnogalacturonyl hydrolase n=1 Tax=Catalinimonas alkaloidigena TaxID=1075417 RepID=A0A1G9DIB0_9BACT|nr:glycoside hydrolase family 88 protein [Catalinimonas alkaloidigena]SDK63580.1 unsaturated rhamnogalacturonyl hydrolase [Catalinimonas alkaloidigena]
MKKLLVFLCFLCLAPSLRAQAQKPWSVRMAESLMAKYPDSIVIGDKTYTRWDYEQGLVLEALRRVWRRTGDGKYYDYIKHDIDLFVQDDGTITTYDFESFNIDNLPPGRALLMLYEQTGEAKYKKAAYELRRQLAEQPRTKEGGFWHKKRYPYQMWLDGLYMGEPFYAEFSQVFNEPENFDDIARQFELIEKHLVDEKTGLLYHGYDESRQQKWADPKTGRSPNYWGRAIGWYAMALVDVLDNFPKEHPKYSSLVSYLQRLAPVLVNYQDDSGCWYQIVDQGSRQGNYLEASASNMFVYSLLKGVRMGYLNASFLAPAQKGYQCILDNFIDVAPDGMVHLDKTVSVGGLGGNPYRSGSYDYYLSEPIRPDDLKGVGPFIKASVEMEMVDEQKVGKGLRVGLDYYFNHEVRNTKDGKKERYHYTWEDPTNSGFKLWGETFQHFGATIDSVATAPTAASLKNVDVYIIVDPDTKKESPNPHFVEKKDIKALETWVKAGGVLVLMSNDTSNVEHVHFNELAKAFGMQFLPKNLNMVKNNQFEQGLVKTPAGHPIFQEPLNLYLKEIAPLSVKSPAEGVLTHHGEILMAVAKVGKGTVFAVGDPWLYNEYVDGRKLPGTFQNFEAGKALAKWLLEQAGPASDNP